MAKLPPYAKYIPENQDCIIVCTGSAAWKRAKSVTWMGHLSKTLLPLSDDINAYRWSFAYNKDVVLFTHGTEESYSRLIELSRALLQYGALMVLWCIPRYPVNKFVSKEGI